MTLGESPKVRVNCMPCREDKHDNCSDVECLCAVETNHNEFESKYNGTFESPEYSYIKENRKPIVDLLRKQGVNLKGIRMEQGKAQDDSWMKWKTETCTEELPAEINYMVIGGKISNGLASTIFFKPSGLSDIPSKKGGFFT